MSSLERLSPNRPIEDKKRENELTELILRRLGINTPPNPKELNQIIVTACQKFHCEPDEYIHRLAQSSEDSPLMEHLISGVTIGETYFFRDKNQIHTLKTNLLPKIINHKREQHNLSLRIWSAGCSSGEEIYTISIMLHELLPDIHRWQISLLGSDINTSSLQKAQSGQYNKWSMRSTPDHYRQHYFIETEKQYKLSAKIMDKVHFIYLNLNENTYPTILNGTNAQDLIICRNVLIYFSRDSIAQLMKKLSKSLVDGGYLLLGASDPVCLEGTNLLFHHQDGMVFSRPDSPNTPAPIMKEPVKMKPPILPPLKSKIELSELKPLENNNNIKMQAEQLVSKAKEAADKGLSKQALEYCQQSLKLDPTNKDTHFIFALILIELNQLSEAESALRKTLYLDNKFVEGHFQLGILLLNQKRYKEGLKSLDNALTIVNRNDPALIVPESQGLSYRRFAEIIKAEIELYKAQGA